MRVFALVVLFASAAVVAHGASTWLGPAVPPTGMSNLDTILDLRDFISTSKLERQFVQGPLYVRNKANANTDQYPARFGLDASFGLTTVVSEFGKRFSIAIGSDGLPVVAYQGTGNSLRVIKCTNLLCSAVNSPQQPGPATDTNLYTSMTIGTDDFPILAYHTQINVDASNQGQLKVVHCVDIACANTVDVARELEHGNDVDFGRYASIAIGNDNLPIISYWDSDQGVAVIHCKDARCSAHYPRTIVDSTNNGSGTYAGQEGMLTVRPDGMAVIAYRGSSSSYLRTVVVNCSSGSCTVASGPAQQNNCNPLPSCGVDSYISIKTNPADGDRPILAYNRDGGVRVARCANVNCSSYSPAAPVVIDASAEKPSLAIGLDGLPVIAYYDSTAPDNMKVAHCRDVSCSTFDSTTIDSSTDSSSNADTRLAIGSDGFPVIVYRSEGGTDKDKIVHCADVACQLTGSRRVGILGIGDGTATSGVVPSITQGANVGIMGYTDNANSYGIYLSSLLGTTTNAQVDEAGEWAGQFYGPVQVMNPAVGNYYGDLSVASTFTASNGLRASSTLPLPGIDLFGSRGTSGTQAIRGVTSGGIAGYGIQGMSTAASSNEASISLVTHEESQALFGQSNTTYGILGRSNTKNGILAEATASDENIGAHGTSVDYGVYGDAAFVISGDKFGDPATNYVSQPAGVGVFACTSGAVAGHFEGSVRVAGQLDMGVRSQTYVVNSGGSTVIWKFITPDASLTESSLQSIWSACTSAGGCTGSLPTL
ncbi:MAG: hypothetical protein AAB490_00660 [Patescibacteria group bacterium]